MPSSSVTPTPRRARCFPRCCGEPIRHQSIPASGFRSSFQRWLAELAVTDEHGQPVWITPHQRRHTFGTRLINRHVQQHIVQQLMDHSLPGMTAAGRRVSVTALAARAGVSRAFIYAHPDLADAARDVGSRRRQFQA